MLTNTTIQPSKIPSKAPRITMVCVTNQFSCERIIKAGRVIADLTNTQLNIISISAAKYPPNPLAMEHLYRISRENGGVMQVEYAEDPFKALISYIKSNKISNVITGVPQDEDSVLYQLWGKFTHLTFFTVDDQGQLQEARSIGSHSSMRMQ